MSRLLHICVSEKKGTVKSEVERAELVPQHGIRDDAHAGPGPRQISLLAAEDIETMRQKGLRLAPGAFGENLVLEGLAVADLAIGTELTIGEATLRVTTIGKVCHHRCAIYHQTGDCIMPRRGVFAEVVTGGQLVAGQPVALSEAPPAHAERCA